MASPPAVLDPLASPTDSDGIRRRTVMGAGVTAVAQALKIGLQFGTQLILARLLDPAQFGLIAMVMPVLGFVMALNDFGFGQAIVQRAQIEHRQVSALFWLNLVIGLGFTLLAMLAAPLIALLYGEPRTVGVTLAAASLIILTSLSVVPLGLLNRQMRFVPLAVIEVTAMVVGLATGIVAARHGAGYWALVMMQAANSVVSMTMAWAFCGWRPSAPRREPGVGSLLRFGANIMGYNLASYLSSSVDNIIVGVVNGKVALGLYDRSYNLITKPLWQLMAPASRVAVPLLSRLQDAPQRYAKAYVIMLQLSTLLCAPGLIATIVLAEPLIALLLGPKWMGMVPVFAWIAFGSLAASVAGSSYWLFTTQNRTDEQVRLSTVTALISVASFAIGSLWGVVGVVRVSALTYMLLQTPLMIRATTRKGPVTMPVMARGLAPLLLAALACGAAMAGVVIVVPVSGAPGMLCIFLAAYLVFLLAFIAHPGGRHLVASARSLVALRKMTQTAPDASPDLRDA